MIGQVSRGLRALSAAAVVSMVAGSVQAGVVFLDGDAFITHSSNFGSTPASNTASVSTIPVYSPSAFQYSGTLSAGTTVSGARLGIGHVTTPSFVGLSLATGTNLTQRGNTNPSPTTASSLRVDFTARWEVTAGGFGPGLQAGASMAILGSLPAAASAFVEVIVSANFSYFPDGDDIGIPLRGPINPTPFLFRNTGGLFNLTQSDLLPVTPGTLSVGDRFQISGFIQFRVHNENEEVSIETREFNNGAPVPAPGAASALALVGLFAARRRR